MLKKKPKKRRLKQHFSTQEYPKQQARGTFPDLPVAGTVGRIIVRKVLPFTLLLLMLFTTNLSAQYSTKDQGALGSFKGLFTESNVGNLHVYAPLSTPAAADYYFRGKLIPRGLFGLFADNWREDLPANFEAYALYTIRQGEDDAYLMRFAGEGTQNMIGMFRIEDGKVRFEKTLANHFCNEQNCWQMDSWIQDFDGDTRLDILQKARMLQYTLMGAPVNEYSQLLLQTHDGEYLTTDKSEVDLSAYDFQNADSK